MEGDRKDAGQDQDLSWLKQYYTSDKTDGRPTEKGDETRIVDRPQGAPAGGGRFALTSLPSAKYEIVGVIGSGGMKVVRRVRDKDTTRTVAMATIRGELDGEEMLARFVREARITAVLEHPNIVPVHDLGTDATGRPYFTMKMLEGESLQEILKKVEARVDGYVPRYGLGALLETFKKVCNAIAFAHSRGVVHLDLKPSNIHVSKFGEVLVLDWGLAKYVGETAEPASGAAAHGLTGGVSDLTLPGAVKGTLGFMAPEQARGENSRKDHRTDVYALGAILYAILTLKAPPSSDTVEGVLADTVAGRIVPPRRRAPERGIPAALEAVAMKALSVDPANRYQSVEELGSDVDAFMGGFPTSAQDVGIVTLLWLLIKRHKIRVTLSAVVLLVIAGITAASVARIRASEREAVEAYRKYRAEQEENRRLAVDAAPQVQKRAEKYIRELRVDDAMRELDVAVTLDSSLAVAWMQKGLLQLARQDFAGAAESFRHLPAPQKAPVQGRRKDKEAPAHVVHPKGKVEKRGGEPESVAEAYAAATENGRRALDGREFAGFITDLVQVLSSAKPAQDIRQAVLFLAFSHWNRTHGTEQEVRAFAGEFVRILNPKAEALAIEVREEAGGLKIAMKGARNLTSIVSLAGLRLVSLDMAGTGVSDIGVLHGMPLEYLDVSGTSVRDLTPVADAPLKELHAEGCRGMDINQLVRLPHLERLVLSRDAVDPKHEASLKGKAGLEVVYR